MRGKHWVIWGVVAALVAAIAVWFHYYRMKPVVNVTPSLHLNVSGKVDSPIASLTLVAYYFTNNPSCRFSESWVEGATSDRSKLFFYPVKIDSKGHYHVSIPLDSLKPGYCNWKIERLSSVVNITRTKIEDNDSGITTLMFGNNENMAGKNLALTMRCEVGSDYIHGIGCLPGKSNLTNNTLPIENNQIKMNYVKVKRIVPLAIIKENKENR